MMLPVLGVAAQSTGVPAECLRSSGLELLRESAALLLRRPGIR